MIAAAFWLDGIAKYEISIIAGVLGITISLLSFAIDPFYPNIIWGLLVAGIFCLYSYIAPVVTQFYNNMGNNNWEKNAITAIISFTLIYLLSFNADILLSNIFLVDPKHFFHSRLIAIIFILAPFALIISTFGMIYFGVPQS